MLRYLTLFLITFILWNSKIEAKEFNSDSISSAIEKEILTISNDLLNKMYKGELQVYNNDSLKNEINLIEYSTSDSITEIHGLKIYFKEISNPLKSKKEFLLYAVAPYVSIKTHGIQLPPQGYGVVKFNDFKKAFGKRKSDFIVVISNLLFGTNNKPSQFPMESYEFEDIENFKIRDNFFDSKYNVTIAHFNLQYLGEILRNRAQEIFDLLKLSNRPGLFYSDIECSKEIGQIDLPNHLSIDEVFYTNIEHTDSIVSTTRNLSFFRYSILLLNNVSIGFMLSDKSSSATFVKREDFYSLLSDWEKVLFDVIAK